MASLRQLLQRHSTLLLLDAASNRVQVGLFTRGTAARWAASETGAGVGLFAGLKELKVNPIDVDAWIFCEGPGSILGIRTTAMAIRAWQVLRPQPAYRYRSLDLVAQSLGRPDARIIADARRECWHCQMAGQTLHRVPTAELAGDLVMPEGFRHWSALPPGVQPTPYRLADLLPPDSDLDLFTATDDPDAFLHEEPSYRTWTPQIHRAP
ncbi:MAG: peptidase M22 [Opitutales bacterium]